MMKIKRNGSISLSRTHNHNPTHTHTHSSRYVNFKIILISFLLISYFLTPAWAAHVDKVKGKKVLINLDGDSANKGNVFYVMSSSGKKKGAVKITSIKGDKAIGLLKGKATSGDQLQAKDNSSKGTKHSSKHQAAQDTSSSSSSSTSSTMGFGILIGMGMDSMSVDLDSTPAEKVSLAGNGLSYKALFDYGLFEKLWFRGSIGMENFLAEGKDVKTACDSKACGVSIQYLSLDFWGRYLFSLSSFRPWLGGGFTLWFPMSKETTALETNSITNTSVMALGGGFDWFINPKFYIPFQAEYGLLPASDQVTASVISVRLGLGMSF